MFRAFRDGARRVNRARGVIAGFWMSTLLLAWPTALVLRQMLAAHLGSSLAADQAARGVNFDWWNEFLAQAVGLGRTFVPAILGFAAVLKNVSSIADAQGVPGSVAGVVGIHLVLSIFLTGGALDRLARDRRLGPHGFFAACGVFFFRFLRLALAAAAVYGLLFAVLHAWLFDDLYRALTHDVTVERTALAYRVLLYLVFGVTLLAANVLFDYAKIRMVVEDRRSAIGAMTAAARFVARYPAPVLGLYLLNTLAFLVLLTFYALLVPGAAGGATAWLALVVGQLYIVLRIAVRLLFMASQTALFQSRLAHAGYVAAPLPAWPESAAAEAIDPH